MDDINAKLHASRTYARVFHTTLSRLQRTTVPWGASTLQADLVASRCCNLSPSHTWRHGRHAADANTATVDIAVRIRDTTVWFQTFAVILSGSQLSVASTEGIIADAASGADELHGTRTAVPPASTPGTGPATALHERVADDQRWRYLFEAVLAPLHELPEYPVEARIAYAARIADRCTALHTACAPEPGR